MSAEAFEAGATTHAGKVRGENEDSFLANTPVGLWVVADGMGGHDAGRLASLTVVETLGRIAAPQSAADLLAQCEARIVEAHARVQQMAAERGSLIGTTLAVLLAFGADYACVWSGDSRIYRVRDGAIALLSRDHTEVQDLVDRGVLTADEARTWPRRNVITRAIGVGVAPELEMDHGRLTPGDVFVLCSDGLTNHVGEQEMRATIATGSPQQASDALVALALERGGSDNVTVVVVRFGAPAW